MSWENWNTRLRARMRENKVSQEKVAEGLGITQGAVAHWLKGRRDINLADFFRACELAGADPREILFGEKAAADVFRDLKALLAENPGLVRMVAIEGEYLPSRPPSPETGATPKRIAHRQVSKGK